MSKTKLCCIILSYNSSEEAIALYNQIKSFSLNCLQVITIDNNSLENEKLRLIEKLPADNLILNSSNYGYASGNEIGIKRAIKKDIPYVLFLNPDIRLTEKTIPSLLHTIAKDQRIAGVGPRICYRDDPTKIYSDGGCILRTGGFQTFHKNYNRYIHEIESPNKISEVDYINGSVFLVRTSVFKEIGLMKQDFFMYFEETEWCMRASKKNYKFVVNRDAVAYHTSSIKGSTYHYYMTRNRLLLSKKEGIHYYKTLKVVGKPIAIDFFNSLKRGKRPSSKALVKAKGFFAGIFGSLKG